MDVLIIPRVCLSGILSKSNMARLLCMRACTFLPNQTLSTILSSHPEHKNKSRNRYQRPRTSHLRSKVAVFVNAFFCRNMSANFFAATKMGSELSADTYAGREICQIKILYDYTNAAQWEKRSDGSQQEHLLLEKASQHHNGYQNISIYICNCGEDSNCNQIHKPTQNIRQTDCLTLSQ